MHAVIVSFDSLATVALGCYGNEWVETPHLDRLAARGITFDRHFADTVGPRAGMAWASGQHALVSTEFAATNSIGHLLKEAQVATRLLVAGELETWHRSAGFDQIATVSGELSTDQAPDQVPFAMLVKAALSNWHDQQFRQQHRLLWLHSAGPGVPPVGFDELYFEDFEERGAQIEGLTEEAKARHPAVYAGAVSLIDHWLGELIAGINQSSSAEPTLIIVTALRGDRWEDFGDFRPDAARTANRSLCDQSIRSPLIMHGSGSDRLADFYSYRSDHLVQTCDLMPTLFDWFGIDRPAPSQLPQACSWFNELTQAASSRQALWVSDENQFEAIRTSDWLCIRRMPDGTLSDPVSLDPSSSIALFEKPEDLWDLNDVASQQAEVVGELLKLFPGNSR